MRRQRPSLLRDKRGYVSLMVIIYCLIAFAAFTAEYFRIIGIREEAENIIQRAINTALEERLRDPIRWDFISELDVPGAWQTFDRVLRVDARLDQNYRHLSSDGRMVWGIEILDRHNSQRPAFLQVEGVIRTRSILSFLSGDVLLPFNVKSKNLRLD